MVRKMEVTRIAARTKDWSMVPFIVRNIETKAMSSLRRVTEVSQ